MAADHDINKLKIAHLNLNGWTVRNGELRKEILKSTNADLICLNETHLKATDSLAMEGYRFLNHYRQRQHIRAVRAFGGVGMFVQEHIFHDFEVNVLD